MIVNNVTLEAVGVKPEQYPQTGLPEIAFVGKSNVGKSSLINAMINRKSLARTSQTPGKTRTINFYNIEKQLYFVDLPGYGYAKISKSESEKWGKMIERYLIKRPQLKSIVLLVDIRHPPSQNDCMMYDWLKHYQYKMVVVATKLDKIKRSQVQKHLTAIRQTLAMTQDDMLIPFSSQTKDGAGMLWTHIESNIESNIEI